MPTLDELSGLDMMGDPSTVPGGSQERFLMGLLSHAAGQKGYQALQLPALALLLRGQLQGFDQQRAQQQKQAEVFKAIQLQHLIEQTKAEQQKAQMAQEQQRQGSLLGGMLANGVPGQSPAPLMTGQAGPEPAPGFQVPNVPASPAQLYAQGLKAGPQGINVVKDLLAAQKEQKPTLHNVPRDTVVIDDAGNIKFKSEARPEATPPPSASLFADLVKKYGSPILAAASPEWKAHETPKAAPESNSREARAIRELNARRAGKPAGSGDPVFANLTDAEVQIIAGLEPKPKADSDKPPAAPAKALTDLINNTYDAALEKNKRLPPKIREAMALEAARAEAKRRGYNVAMQGIINRKLVLIAPEGGPSKSEVEEARRVLGLK